MEGRRSRDSGRSLDVSSGRGIIFKVNSFSLKELFEGPWTNILLFFHFHEWCVGCGVLEKDKHSPGGCFFFSIFFF